MAARKTVAKKHRQDHMNRVIKIDNYALTVRCMAKQEGFNERELINLTKWMSMQKRSDVDVVKYIYK